MLETVKFKIDKFEELKEVKRLVKEILDETITEEYITTLDLVEIIKDFANEIFERDKKIKELEEYIQELKATNGKGYKDDY